MSEGYSRQNSRQSSRSSFAEGILGDGAAHPLLSSLCDSVSSILPPGDTPNEEAHATSQQESSKQVVQYLLMFVGGIAVVRMLLSSVLVIASILVPVAYIYMIQTCPSPQSFDGKRYLKRVLRGQHLPEDHLDKPKGYWREKVARVTANVQANAATLPGYQQELTAYGGALVLAKMTIPTSNMECYWVGALNDWHYVYSRQLNNDKAS